MKNPGNVYIRRRRSQLGRGFIKGMLGSAAQILAKNLPEIIASGSRNSNNATAKRILSSKAGKKAVRFAKWKATGSPRKTKKARKKGNVQTKLLGNLH